MLCRIYGRLDATTFSSTWISLINYVTIYGTRFNWASLLVASLKTNISVALAPEEGYSSEFYMAFYLLDVVCSRCHFEGWAHNWDPKQARPVHIEMQVFWDSKYKKDIESISQQFIPALYRKLFGQDTPCMSWRVMETLVKVSHWFPMLCPDLLWTRCFFKKYVIR